jgi:protein TonB
MERWASGRWVGAIATSVLIHASAAAVLLGDQDEGFKIQGTAGTEIVMLGTFQDSLAAGDAEAVAPAEATDPMAPAAQAVEPVRSETVEPATPVVPEQVRRAPVKAVSALRPEQVKPLESSQAREVVADPMAQALVEITEPEEAVIVASVAPVEKPRDVEEKRPVESAEPVEAAQPLETERLAALSPTDVIEAVEPAPIIPDVAPVPSARPEPVRQAFAKPERPEPKLDPVRKKPERRAGDGGKQESSSRKGQTNGRENGNERASGAGDRKGGTDGNAAVSNYPGKVAAKLRRAVRGVSRSARSGAKRDVHVYFVVTASGGVGSVRVTQSSGSDELDHAALASVRRAAPFPPIPAAAGRSKWEFSVPLGLAR